MSFDTVFLVAWLKGLLPWACIFLLVMLLDFITGALCAWRKGEFRWELAPEFLKNGGLFLWAWLAAEILAAVPGVFRMEIPGWGTSIADIGPKVVWGFIVLSKYVASVVNNIKAIQAVANPKPWAPPSR